MPTYLTPGVYVEEVPSASKPIEGVGTSIAAFVGLAPGGPVNTPMRISNWSQFAKIYGDPEQPDNGPFMEGAYLAHSVYGFFMNGGALCWIVRVGDDTGGARPRAALPAATEKSVEAFRAEALAAAEGEVKVELTQEPSASDKDGDATYKLVVTSGSEREEFEGLTAQEGPHEHRHQGQRLLEAGQDHRPDREPARGPEDAGHRHLHAVQAGPEARGDQAEPLRGRRREAAGHGRPGGRGRDHDGLHAGPHDARLQRRRRPAARPPGQDDRPLRERRRPHGDPRRAGRTCSRRRSSSGG